MAQTIQPNPKAAQQTVSPQGQPQQALTKGETFNDVKAYLDSRAAHMAKLVPKHLTPQRLITVALSARSRTPAIMECTTESLFRALMIAAELGLEAGGPLGHAYLVPFRNRNGTHEVQLIPGYRGLIELARRSGSVSTIEAHLVRENDHFKIVHGLVPVLEHSPSLKQRGDVIAAYTVVRLTNGGVQVELMNRDDLEHVRSKSKSKDNGPWVTDTDEMFRKTVVKRALKYISMSPEMARAVEVDDSHERGEAVDFLGEVREPPKVAGAKDKVLSAAAALEVAQPIEDAPESIPVDREPGSDDGEAAPPFDETQIGAMCAELDKATSIESAGGVYAIMSKWSAEANSNPEIKAKAGEMIAKLPAKLAKKGA